MSVFLLRSSSGGGGDLDSDWTTRSTGPGVVWAHRLNTSAEVNRFKIGTSAQVGFNASDGLDGAGCMELLVPEGETGSGAWGRPLRAISGDLNNPGLPNTGITITNSTDNTSQFNNMHGGHFMHTDYYDDFTDYGGNEFYIFHLVKFSSGRFSPSSFEDEAGSGKHLMIVQSYEGTPNCEIVVQPRTDFGARWYNQYTHGGNGFNPNLWNPQSAASGDVAGDKIQPGGVYDTTCLQGSSTQGGNCYLWPEDTWVAHQIHVTPGHQAGNTSSLAHADNNGSRDTGIQVWIAHSGDTSWTKIVDKSNYVFDFTGSYFDATPQPYGWNWANFTPYCNGSIAASPFYHRISQVILSTQMIACPQVWS